MKVRKKSGKGRGQIVEVRPDIAHLWCGPRCNTHEYVDPEDAPDYVAPEPVPEPASWGRPEPAEDEAAEDSQDAA